MQAPWTYATSGSNRFGPVVSASISSSWTSSTFLEVTLIKFTHDSRSRMLTVILERSTKIMINYVLITLETYVDATVDLRSDVQGRVMRRDDEHILRKVLRADIYQGKGREDDRKQDRRTCANETWKVLDPQGTEILCLREMALRSYDIDNKICWLAFAPCSWGSITSRQSPCTLGRYHSTRPPGYSGRHQGISCARLWRSGQRDGGSVGTRSQWNGSAELETAEMVDETKSRWDIKAKMLSSII